MTDTLTLRHYTDCGGPNGADTEERILQVYEQHGYPDARIRGGLQNPLHVAFTVATRISENLKTDIPYKKSNITTTPIALNAAPRSNSETQGNAVEDYLYNLKFNNPKIPEMVIYGPEVVEWITKFFQEEIESVQQILDISEKGIKNTSNGTQFRSKAYLTIAQIAATEGRLLELSNTQKDKTKEYESIQIKDGEIIPIPEDEFRNGRFILNTNTWKHLRSKQEFSFKDKNKGNPIPIVSSLTDVELNQWGIWEFSNKLPGDNVVIGCATRKNVGERENTIQIEI